MTYIQLESHVGFGLVGDRPVFLDLARDRYLALPPTIEHVFTNLCAQGEPVLPEGPERDLLLGTGLFRTGSLLGRGVKPATVPRCSASLLDEPARPRAGLRAILAARASVGHARKQLAGRPLREIVDAIRENRFAARPDDTSAGIEDDHLVIDVPGIGQELGRQHFLERDLHRHLGRKACPSSHGGRSLCGRCP